MGPEQKPGIRLCFQHPELTVKAACRKIGSYGYRYSGSFFRLHPYVTEAIEKSVPELVQIKLDARERKKQWQNNKNGQNLQSSKS